VIESAGGAIHVQDQLVFHGQRAFQANGAAERQDDHAQLTLTADKIGRSQENQYGADGFGKSKTAKEFRIAVATEKALV